MTFYFDRRTRDDVFPDSIKGSTMYHCWYNEGKTVLCCCYFFHSEGEKRWDYSEMKVSIDASIIVDDLKRIFKNEESKYFQIYFVFRISKFPSPLFKSYFNIRRNDKGENGIPFVNGI